MLDTEREMVKNSIKYVLEQWVVHHQMAKDSHSQIKCVNCGRLDLMNVTFIDDGDPVKITYQCRCCHAHTEHECMLGRGKVFATKEEGHNMDMIHLRELCRGDLLPVWQILNRRRFPAVCSYMPLDDALAIGCSSISNIPIENWDRHPKRIGLILSRIGEDEEPPAYWIPRPFFQAIRATSLPEDLDMGRISHAWASGIYMLPEDTLFSPTDGSCPFIGMAWQRAGKYYFFDHPLENILNLMDKLVVWTVAPKSGVIFTAELNLGGPLGKVDLDQSQRPKEPEDGEFCLTLLKIAIKLTILTESHPQFLEHGARLQHSEFHEPNWLGREFRRETVHIGAGACLSPTPRLAV